MTNRRDDRPDSRHRVIVDGLDERAAARYERWDRISRPFIIVAALAPVLIASDLTAPRVDAAVLGVDLVFWVVFVVDLGVRMKLRPGYLRMGWGRFDLAVVLLTFPWYLVFGTGTQLMGLARLGRLVRIAIALWALPTAHRLFTRLNRAMIYFVLIWLSGSYFVYQAQDGEAGFDTYGDALWWGIVTVATVGYGDLVPTSGSAQIVAGVLMISGLALLGTVAATLASVFRLDDIDTASSHGPVSEAAAGAPSEGEVLTEVLAEVRGLRAEVAMLRSQLEPGSTEPPE